MNYEISLTANRNAAAEEADEFTGYDLKRLLSYSG